MSDLAANSSIGLVAGGGELPLEFARQARARGLRVVAVAHHGETDPRIQELVDDYSWVYVGQLGTLIKYLRSQRISQAAFAGGISRVRLFRGVKLDLRGAALIARLGSVKDDVVLRGVAAELETEGIRVISAGEVLERAVVREGQLTRRGLTEDELRNARIGWSAALAIGALDIGQTVVVTQGVVSAVEAVEGTDLAIRRAGDLAGPGGVVVKLAKPHQDLRIDLPTIGPKTIDVMGESGASALVLHADHGLLLDPTKVVEHADQRGIAIHAFQDLR